jgi:NAD(P)-dependent dehydrogenase (short-subunit alcohol dehydrogenase family)
MRAFRLFAVAVAAALALASHAIAQEAPPMPPAVKDGNGRAVLITGASSGFGRRLTELLSQNGWFVYAGARSAEDLDALGRMKNVQPLKLDVNVQADVDAAVKQVEAGGRGLYGLVNNAGVAVLMPLGLMDEEDYDYVMLTNVKGPWRMAKAFAPMIVASKGRIVNTSSISGIFAALGLGAYSMSKHALEALNDALAQELAPFGVRVIAIEPGNFDTNVGKTAKARMIEKGQNYDGLPYKDQLEATLNRLVEPDGKEGPDRVALTMAQALGADDPLPRYLVVSNERDAQITLSLALKKVAQLNASQGYRYSADELRAMFQKQIDAAMTK